MEFSKRVSKSSPKEEDPKSDPGIDPQMEPKMHPPGYRKCAKNIGNPLCFRSSGLPEGGQFQGHVWGHFRVPLFRKVVIFLLGASIPKGIILLMNGSSSIKSFPFIIIH